MSLHNCYPCCSLQAASPYAALLYGNKEWVGGGEILRYGIVLVLLAMFLYTVFGIPAALVIF